MSDPNSSISYEMSVDDDSPPEMPCDYLFDVFGYKSVVRMTVGDLPIIDRAMGILAQGAAMAVGTNRQADYRQCVQMVAAGVMIGSAMFIEGGGSRLKAVQDLASAHIACRVVGITLSEGTPQ